jgi:hypothetical protein
MKNKVIISCAVTTRWLASHERSLYFFHDQSRQPLLAIV